MAATVRGGPVLPHVQAFCNRVAAEVPGISAAGDFGTRADHQPSRERAVDIFVPTSSRTRGDAVCALALKHWDGYGLEYIIFRQHINSNDGRGWRLMADRGSPTQNHVDHAHVAFRPTVPGRPQPRPTPTPPPQEDSMAAAYLVCRQDGRWYLTNLIDKPRYIKELGVLQMLTRNGVPLLNKDAIPGKPAGTIEDDVWRQISGEA